VTILAAILTLLGTAAAIARWWRNEWFWAPGYWSRVLGHAKDVEEHPGDLMGEKNSDPRFR
jgi:hypothetical protein